MWFAQGLAKHPRFSKLNPSGYVESQGAFTLRMAQEMRSRLNLPCLVELKKQTEFPEPRVRINTDVLDADALGWDESAAWDDLAAYYQRLHGQVIPASRSSQWRATSIARPSFRTRSSTSRCVVAGLASSFPRGSVGVSLREEIDKLADFGVDIVLLRHSLGTCPPHRFEDSAVRR